MQIMITDLSLYAKTILEQHSSWTVHSVYRKTINLQSGDLLLALQTAGSPLSPISLITDLSEAGMDAQKAVPGMEIPSSALQTDQANVRDLFLSPFSGSFGELSAAIHQAICQADDQGFRLLFLPDRQGNASLIMEAAKKSLTDCRLFLQKQETKAAAAALVRLTGLGIGLTPSGDDFLCGALGNSLCCLPKKSGSRPSSGYQRHQPGISCLRAGAAVQPARRVPWKIFRRSYFR